MYVSDVYVNYATIFAVKEFSYEMPFVFIFALSRQLYIRLRTFLISKSDLVVIVLFDAFDTDYDMSFFKFAVFILAHATDKGDELAASY